MEQARDAAHAVTEFFQGNPMQTPVGQRIEQASQPSSSGDEWDQYMDICDVVCSYEEGPRDAARAIKKRLQQYMGKDSVVVRNTLTILDTCVKNCGSDFHRAVCQKDFVQELIRLVGTKYKSPLDVQERVLSMIKQWATTFRGNRDLSGVCEVYDELLSKGVEFTENENAVAPIVTPKVVHTFTSNETQRHIVPGISDHQMAKLRSELDIVNGNLSVFRELLSELKPGQEEPENFQLLEGLNETCREMQRRIVQLLEQIFDDSITSELLMINDEMNTVFAKYERYMKNRESLNQTKPDTSSDSTALIDFSDDSQRDNPDEPVVDFVNVSTPSISGEQANNSAASCDSSVKRDEFFKS